VIAAASVGKTRGKEGCLYYSFAEDVGELGLFRVAEGWRDRKVLDFHLASRDFAETLQQAGTLRMGVSWSLCIWSGPCGFQIRSRIEALVEHDSELISGGKPFPEISAAFLEVADGQVDQLRRGLLGWE